MKWTVMMMVTIVVDYNINCNDYDGEVNDMIVVMIDLFTKCNAMPSAFNWIQIPQFLSSSSSPLLSKVFIVIVTIVIKNFHPYRHHCHNFFLCPLHYCHQKISSSCPHVEALGSGVKYYITVESEWTKPGTQTRNPKTQKIQNPKNKKSKKYSDCKMKQIFRLLNPKNILTALLVQVVNAGRSTFNV